MDLIFFFALLGFLGYRIHLLAKMKEQSSVLWIVLMVVAFIFGEAFACMLVLFVFSNGAINMSQLQDPKNMDAVTQQANDLLASNPFHSVLILLGGFGGFLLIRYILEKMPGKKNDNNVHWMDKVNQNQR